MTFKNFLDTFGRKLQVKLSLPKKLGSINGFLAQQTCFSESSRQKKIFNSILSLRFRRVGFDIGGSVLFWRFGAGVSHFSLFEGLGLIPVKKATSVFFFFPFQMPFTF